MQSLTKSQPYHAALQSLALLFSLLCFYGLVVAVVIMIVGVSFLTGLASSDDSVAKRALFLTCQQRVCHIILLVFLTRSSLSLLFSILSPCVVTFRVMLVSLCDLGRTPAPFSSSLCTEPICCL